MKTNNKEINMVKRIDQSIKLQSLDERTDKMANQIDNCNKKIEENIIEKVEHMQKTLTKNRKWFIPIICLLFFTFGVCSTVAVYYVLIESNLIRKKKIRLDYEVKKNENDPDDAGNIYIKPIYY